jgi:protein-tyrosine phosphatase
MFFSKKKASTDLSWVETDIHSHLLPGIDDGSPDLATSIELIRGMVDLGYRKIITTPHILWEMYPNTPEIIAGKLAELKSAVAAEGIKVELHAAAEYYIDDHFDMQLQAKAPLLTLKDNIVLVEFSMITAPMELQSVIFEMQIQNYQPLIAHPERYVYMSRQKEFFDSLKDAGCLFQLNLLALSGGYGAAVQELAEYLLKKEYYDYVGTDLHNFRHLEGLRRISSSIIRKLEDSELIKNHLL